jgi:tetratricopeptide (TPR) repeat protein
MNLGQWGKALADCSRALELDPESATAWTDRGAVYRNLGQPDKALADCSKALELDPRYADAWVGRAATLVLLGRPNKAEADCQEALRLRPDDPLAYKALGAALYQQGKLTEAEAAIREAIRLRRDYAGAHYNLGQVLAAQGKLPEAEAAYQEELRPQPDFPEAHCNLGVVLRRQGRFAEALASLKRGHELGSKQPGWRYPSAQWVRQAEQLVALDAKLPKCLKGEAEPADAGECIGLARLCQQYKKRYAAAARFYAEAFTSEPKQADDLRSQDRYNAACAAALACCGQGEDADKLAEPERARLQRQALDWLRADLAAWGQLLEKGSDAARADVQRTLRHWQQDADFAGVRGDALAKLPDPERRAWQQLWADVEKLLKKSAP